MMEPIALTKSSPDAAGAGRTAVGLRVLKPKRARAGKEESRRSPRTAFLGPYLLVGFWHGAPLWPLILGMAVIWGTADRDFRSHKLGANG